MASSRRGAPPSFGRQPGLGGHRGPALLVAAQLAGGMDQRFSKPYSEQTAQAIDEEVKKMIDSAYQRTKKLLNEKRDQLEIIAKELLEKEIIFKADMERLIGHRPYDEKHPDLTHKPTETITEEIKES